jgi:hypothetical protein
MDFALCATQTFGNSLPYMQDDDAQGQGVSLPSAGMPYSGRELVDACKAIFDLVGQLVP